jgi:hypothetical protein
MYMHLNLGFHHRLNDQDSDRRQSCPNHLKLLIDKQDYEDRHQCIVNDWRFVALVMDRILFWIFLSAFPYANRTSSVAQIN